MILYTPLSESEIFPYEEETMKREFVSHEGRTLYVEHSEDGAYKLIQLMSTDPQDFLNETYMPGTILS